jgi:glycosyltransferase involved in cell wall biosynthesis
VGGEFQFIDFRMRWQDKNRPKLYVIISWLLCAATLPRRRSYAVFLIDNLHIPPVLMKRCFLRRDQKIIVHLGSHTMYFLLSHRFSRLVERLHVWALRNYDALICEGRMTVEMAQELLGDKHPPIYETFIGTPTDRLESLMEVEPNLESRRIVFIGSGPGEFRMHYKGLDLMIEAVTIAADIDLEIELDILGEWDDAIVDSLMASIPAAMRRRIRFRGSVERIAQSLQEASLYLHCARGESFGVAVLEAMSAGVVPLVSDWTGARQAVAEVCDRLIAPLDAEEIARRISWYFALDAEERQRLSERSRTAARAYTEEAAAAHYKTTFNRICEDLGVAGAEGRSA